MTTIAPIRRFRVRCMHDQAGVSLMETMFALLVLLIVATGVIPLGLVATKAVENQGHLAARTTEYSQDKMEQLLALAFGDAASDTRVFPTIQTGGTGLAPGGSADSTAVVNGYVDYLDKDGNPLASGGGPPANWFFMRAWRVQTEKTHPITGVVTLKRITVTSTVRNASQGGLGATPISTVTALKASPF
jgi:hypothetical protein